MLWLYRIIDWLLLDHSLCERSEGTQPDITGLSIYKKYYKDSHSGITEYAVRIAAIPAGPLSKSGSLVLQQNIRYNFSNVSKVLH